MLINACEAMQNAWHVAGKGHDEICGSKGTCNVAKRERGSGTGRGACEYCGAAEYCAPEYCGIGGGGGGALIGSTQRVSTNYMSQSESIAAVGAPCCDGALPRWKAPVGRGAAEEGWAASPSTAAAAAVAGAAEAAAVPPAAAEPQTAAAGVVGALVAPAGVGPEAEEPADNSTCSGITACRDRGAYNGDSVRRAVSPAQAAAAEVLLAAARRRMAAWLAAGWQRASPAQQAARHAGPELYTLVGLGATTLQYSMPACKEESSTWCTGADGSGAGAGGGGGGGGGAGAGAAAGCAGASWGGAASAGLGGAGALVAMGGGIAGSEAVRAAALELCIAHRKGVSTAYLSSNRPRWISYIAWNPARTGGDSFASSACASSSSCWKQTHATSSCQQGRWQLRADAQVTQSHV